MEEHVCCDCALFTETDRKKLEAVYTAVNELQVLVKQVEPFLDSFLGGSNSGPTNPMSMILGSLMGGKR